MSCYVFNYFPGIETLCQPFNNFKPLVITKWESQLLKNFQITLFNDFSWIFHLFKIQQNISILKTSQSPIERLKLPTTIDTEQLFLNAISA